MNTVATVKSPCPGWGEHARYDRDGRYCPVCGHRFKRVNRGDTVPKHMREEIPNELS